MNRRTFLRTSALAGAGLSVVPHLRANPSDLIQGDVPKPCVPSAWKKHGIILEATEPWEKGSVQNFTTTAEPLKNGEWRIWYSVSSGKEFNLAYAEGVPGSSMKKTAAVCSPSEPADAPFAIGNLPVDWKPTQGIHIVLTDGRHRIYFWAHGPRVCRYLAADSDDGRRYRVLDPTRAVLYQASDRAASNVPTVDGAILHSVKNPQRPANEPVAESRRICNDATNVYLLPDGTFEFYSAGLVLVSKGDPAYIAADIVPGWVRVIDRYTSKDGLHIDTRQRVIQCDTKDSADQQFYYLSVTPTSRGRVGMLGRYPCEAQTMDIEWCYSRDGIRWERPRREVWIPRGEPPAPDCYAIYANNQLVQHDGKWHLFYTGVNALHNGKKSAGKPRQVVMYATTESIWA